MASAHEFGLVQRRGIVLPHRFTEASSKRPASPKGGGRQERSRCSRRMVLVGWRTLPACFSNSVLGSKSV